MSLEFSPPPPPPPPLSVVKLNVDVAISKDFFTLAIIAHDDKGQILKASAKEHLIYEPLQTEALAILWALELVEAEKFDRIIVEGDAKTCYDILNGESLAVNRSISSVINNIVTYSVWLGRCDFV
jgi:hypothetical protein